jgi:hypothetical protein
MRQGRGRRILMMLFLHALAQGRRGPLPSVMRQDQRTCGAEECGGGRPGLFRSGRPRS